MKITILGAGYVGLVTGACLADFGHRVVCIDTNPDRLAELKAGKIPIYEPGLQPLVQSNVEAGNLAFSETFESVADSDAVFIAVGTPTQRGGSHADLTYVFGAADKIAAELKQKTVVVCKSTVPVGTTRRVLEKIRSLRPDVPIEAASNPEFLREGSAIEDFKRPDRVVVGVESEHAKQVMHGIYRPLSLNQTPIVYTGFETAELTKYAANAFLATKITFINEMADLCEQVGANVQEVARGMGLDRRIGSKFLHAGPGYGGSCFPKDTLALLKTAEDAGAALQIVGSVVAVNDERKGSWADRLVAKLGGSGEGKTVAVLGLTFKPNTDDMRDAPSLAIVPRLLESGAAVRVHDPKGMDNARGLIEGVTWCHDALEAAQGADAIMITTEWDVYRAMDLNALMDTMKGTLFFDLRNIYEADEMARQGFDYHGVGIGSPRKVGVDI